MRNVNSKCKFNSVQPLYQAFIKRVYILMDNRIGQYISSIKTGSPNLDLPIRRSSDFKIFFLISRSHFDLFIIWTKYSRYFAPIAFAQKTAKIIINWRILTKSVSVAPASFVYTKRLFKFTIVRFTMDLCTPSKHVFRYNFECYCLLLCCLFFFSSSFPRKVSHDRFSIIHKQFLAKNTKFAL